MKHILLAVALLHVALPRLSHASNTPEPSIPCGTFEPECSDPWGNGDENDSDGDGEPDRPADPDGPDYGGQEI